MQRLEELESKEEEEEEKDTLREKAWRKACKEETINQGTSEDDEWADPDTEGACFHSISLSYHLI